MRYETDLQGGRRRSRICRDEALIALWVVGEHPFGGGAHHLFHGPMVVGVYAARTPAPWARSRFSNTLHKDALHLSHRNQDPRTNMNRPQFPGRD